MPIEKPNEPTRAARSCKKLIRFAPAELATVNERARAAGQPVACYIRDAAIGVRKRAVSTVSLGGPMIRELSRVATRLCALRDTASERGLPEATDFGSAVEELLGLIRRIE